MLLPGSLLDTLLFLRALGTLIAPLLGVLLLVVAVLPLLWLSVLLLVVAVLPLLLLSVLLLVVAVLPLLLLSVLLLVVAVLPLLLLGVLLRLLLFGRLPLLLSMLLFGLGLLVLALLLLGMVLLCALLFLPRVGRSSNREKQRQNGCAGDSNYFHRCYLQNYSVCMLALAQAACCRVNRAAYGFAGHEKFNSPVLLPSGGNIVGGYR